MVKRKLIWSPQSKIELFEIMDFYKKRNGNTSYSLKLYNQIEELLKLCQTYSFIGKRTDIENVRILTVEDFLIFYEISSKEITVLTIWSSKRNPNSLQI